MTIKYPYPLLAGLLCTFGPLTATAAVKMPAIFGDHMVLQEDLKLSVWGTADPGEAVTVSISGHQAKATADKDGNWRVQLDPLPASAQATELHVAGPGNSFDFKDVLIGDVWLCSGQSNMEFGIGNASNAAEAIASANQPDIRLFLVGKKTSLTPLADVVAKWVVCTPASVAQGGWNGFSAAGYFFAKEIQADRKVPIGLIGSYWGGTPAQAWTDLASLQAQPALKTFADSYTNTVDHLAELKLKYDQETLPAWQKAHEDWVAKVNAPFKAAMEQWKKDADQAKLAGQPPPAEPKLAAPEPRKPVFAGDSPNSPTLLFNGMIHPLLTYGIKGAIWYQGEANGGSVASSDQYAILFPAMISGWRQLWGEGNFAFLYVQLAGFAPGTAWPYLRDAQTRTLSLPNTGMAVALDIGLERNVHPTDKLDVGHRLALAARHVAYGEDLVYSGPTYDGMKVDGKEVRVSFKHAGGGLVIGASPAPDATGAKATSADTLEGFEIAGADGKFVPATARIDGDAVVVSAAEVTAPMAVRYGWKGFPAVNLYNREGLPACPFSSQSTPIVP
jgi:sialate O-acetylesterase